MNRRTFFTASAALGLVGLAPARRAVARDDRAGFPEPAPLPFREEKSRLKITGIRAVQLVPIRPLPKYEPTPGRGIRPRSRSPIRCRSIRDSSRGVRCSTPMISAPIR